MAIGIPETSTAHNLRPARWHADRPAAPSAVAPFLEPSEPTTDFAQYDLPHATWGSAYRPALRAFAAASPSMKAAKLVPYDRIPLWLTARLAWERRRNGGQRPFGVYTDTWNLPVNAIRDSGLRAEMMLLAEAMYHYEFPPGGAVILTDMLDDLTPTCSLELFGWLRAALVELSGAGASAVCSPTGNSGGAIVADENHVHDNRLSPHSDLWIPAMLFNYFNRVVPGEGQSQLMPMEQLWPLAESCGMPPDVIAEARRTLVESGECDYYDRFVSILYEFHPWSEELERELYTRSMTAWMKPGEGYFLNDREWLHGRSAVSTAPPEHKQHRIYRLAYNNARLEAAGTQRRIEWEKRDYLPIGCKR